MTYDMQDFYKDVQTFNRAAGKDTVSTKQQLLDQIKLIQEELDELREGVENSDPEEILDGAADVGVTFFGLVSQLENLGFNFRGAAHTTAMNNLTKFVQEEYIAIESVIALREAEPNRQFRYVQDANTGYYVILDDNNKVRKPIGYVKNDLKGYFPLDYDKKISQ